MADAEKIYKAVDALVGDALPGIQMDVFKFQVAIIPHTLQFILNKISYKHSSTQPIL